MQGDFGLSLFEDGLLPAAFMVGLLVSSPLFAEASKHYNAFRLIGIGLGVWAVAVAGCGLSVGFVSLLLCRMAVGVGEASFVALASPFIGKHILQAGLVLARRLKGSPQSSTLQGLALAPWGHPRSWARQLHPSSTSRLLCPLLSLLLPTPCSPWVGPILHANLTLCAPKNKRPDLLCTFCRPPCRRQRPT